MPIYLSNTTTVHEIQEIFHAAYPRLQLVFFKKPHTRGEKPIPGNRVTPNTPLEKITAFRSQGWLDIGYFRTAAAIEHELRHKYGLHSHVFRKSGRSWFPTRGTNDQTLEELNTAGPAEESLPLR
ncbi:hypothetical protein [Chitinophaga sp. 212800010-3]|uniref:hypothetical protein n=1 Tax=unclassified Chitinophaga TaxID=2619133 RepID=UPI002DF06F3D|nr:hypothetical protein [Chitinophaga sp. 212800010-3]